MVPQSTHVREVSRTEHPVSRYLPDVISRVLEEIPLFTHKELVADLLKLRDTALYTPQECMAALWIALENCLNRHLGEEMSSDWEKRIAAKLRNEPVVAVEHPSAWRADWQARWDRAGGIHYVDARLSSEKRLLNELVKRIATCPESEINDVRAAARYAVGE